MFTRRGFLSGSAAALMIGAGEARAQAAPRVRVIDIHAHWYPPEWVALLEREGDANGAKMGRNARGNVTASIPGLSVSFQPQYIDIGTRLAAMDKAGVAMHALSLTQPMAFWAPPAFGLKLCQTYNDACVGGPPEASGPLRRIGDAADAGPRPGAAGVRPRRQASRHPRHLHGDPHQRPEPRRQGVLAGLCALRGARPADLAAPGQSGRRRSDAPLPPAQFHRQSDRHRDRRGLVDLQRRARCLSRSSISCCRMPAACCRS